MSAPQYANWAVFQKHTAGIDVIFIADEGGSPPSLIDGTSHDSHRTPDIACGTCTLRAVLHEEFVSWISGRSQLGYVVIVSMMPFVVYGLFA
jgi:hypothetical protein